MKTMKLVFMVDIEDESKWDAETLNAAVVEDFECPESVALDMLQNVMVQAGNNLIAGYRDVFASEIL